MTCSKEGEGSVRRYPTIEMIAEIIEEEPIQHGRFTQIDIVVEPFLFFLQEIKAKRDHNYHHPFPKEICKGDTLGKMPPIFFHFPTLFYNGSKNVTNYFYLLSPYANK